MKLSIHYFLLLLAISVPDPVGAGEIIRTGPIQVFGNRQTRARIIEEQIPLKTGDPFDYRLVQEGKRRIALLPGIEYVDIKVYYVPSDSSLGLSVVVAERSTLSGGMWLQRAYEDKISIGMRAGNTNFRGQSEAIEVSVLLVNTVAADAFWETPRVRSNRLKLGLGVRGFISDFDYVYNDFGARYKGKSVRRIGGCLYLFRNIAGGSRIQVAAGYQSVASDTAGMTLGDGDDNMATFSLSLASDSRDDVRFPFSGHRLAVTLTSLGPGQEEFGMTETEIDARLYWRMIGRMVAAIQAGWVHRYGPRIPIYDRSHLGGGNTLRGYEYGTFHGDHSFLQSTELRIPLNFSNEYPLERVLLGIEFHIFADWGAAWGSDLLPGRPPRAGFGAGFAILADYIEGLRVDYGVVEGEKGVWHAEVGMKF